MMALLSLLKIIFYNTVYNKERRYKIVSFFCFLRSRLYEQIINRCLRERSLIHDKKGHQKFFISYLLQKISLHNYFFCHIIEMQMIKRRFFMNKYTANAGQTYMPVQDNIHIFFYRTQHQQNHHRFSKHLNSSHHILKKVLSLLHKNSIFYQV